MCHVNGTREIVLQEQKLMSFCYEKCDRLFDTEEYNLGLTKSSREEHEENRLSRRL